MWNGTPGERIPYSFAAIAHAPNACKEFGDAASNAAYEQRRSGIGRTAPSLPGRKHPMASARPHIVIVGGGFAGANLTRLLQKRAKFADITLVSEESYTTFNPMLAEVVGATVFPEHVVAPLRATVGRARFVMGTVGNVDFERKRLVCDTLKREVEIKYDHLVLAFGNRARVDSEPAGVTDMVWGLFLESARANGTPTRFPCCPAGSASSSRNS